MGVLFWTTAAIPNRRRHRGGRSRASGPPAGVGLRLWSYLYLGLPVQVWAAPPSLQDFVSAARQATAALPEPLDRTISGSQVIEHSTVPAELRESILQQAIRHDLGQPLTDTADLPVPPLHPVPDDTSVPAPAFEGICYAIAPQYQAEVLRLTLSPPLDLAAFNSAVRDALRHLRLPFCYVIVPTFPQLSVDFASVAIIPKWLPQAGRQVVIFDFRALDDGPVYARIVSEQVTHQECEQEAVHRGFRHTSIYAQGHSRALEVGDTFLASPGCVVQFQPSGRPAQWCGTLAAKFDRPQWWLPEPRLPAFPRERPVLVLYHDYSTLYSAARHPGVPTLRFLADLVDRSPERVLYISPPSSALTNVDYRGTACRDALAIFPLTPTPERAGILVFLDPRQAGKEVTHVYLPSHAADPHFLVRLLDLRPPSCYRVAILPRPERRGLLLLSEGDIVTFGYKEDHPWSTGDEGSATSEGEGSDPGCLSDEEPSADGDTAAGVSAPSAPRGPPPPIPVSSQRIHSQMPARARSRSPRPDQRPLSSRQAIQGSGNALTSSLLGVALGLTQPRPAEGYLQVPHNHGGYLSGFLDAAGLTAAGVLAVCVLAVVFWHICASTCRHFDPCRTIQCKLLAEPVGRNYMENRTLNRLRDATRRLDGRWITDPPLGLPGALHLQLGADDTSDLEGDDDVCTVSCVILCPEYTAEAIDVRLPIPATVDEVSLALRAARQPAARTRFPQLVPALPQPFLGIASFVAYPAWDFEGVLVCLDTTAIDGRLFATKMPARVCKSDLVYAAGLLPCLDYDVLYNVDQEPIQDGLVHLFPGALVTFLHVGCLWPAPHDLSELLQSRLAWGEATGLPASSYANAYCLVHETTATLCVDTGHHPARYRDNIAFATGADPSRMRLFAATPAPPDSAIQGVPCTTVLAVGHPPERDPHTIWHYALLDCRPLLASWRAICVQAGSMPQNLLFDSLAGLAPPGRELRVDGHPERHGVLWLAPGQVVVVTAAEPTSLIDTSAYRLGAYHSSETVAPSGRPQHAESAGLRPLWHEDTQSTPGPTSLTAAATPDPAGRSAEGTECDISQENAQSPPRDPWSSFTFEVYVLDYVAEVITVRLQMPCSLSYALQRLSSARDPVSRARFPRLFPASHQSSTAHGLVLS